jgi:rifampicin phosphotransferase
MTDLAINKNNESWNENEKGRIISLSSANKVPIDIVGGKAFNLLEMVKAGFRVPPGLIISTELYKEYLADNKIDDAISNYLVNIDFNDKDSIAKCSANIKGLIISGAMKKSLEEDIERMLSAIGNDILWAIRSSAAAEDLPEASFAGQQDTFLNVRKDDAPAFVKRCWASYWNERAIAYRHNADIGQLDGGMAVVLQKMVNAEVSGVMFTVDPMNGQDNIIIESSWGLGESIVSGIVIPDKFVYNKKSGQITEREISRKTKGIFFSQAGSVATDIEEARQQAPSLDDSRIHSLVEAGKNIEGYFGAAQDVEWAIEGGVVHILQSRPITTLVEDQTLWTRAYGDEYWADVVSPLFLSLLGDYLTKYVLDEGNQIMGYKDLAGKDLLKVHKGHIYFNAEVLEGIFTYNPKFSRTKELLNYFPEKDQPRIANAPTKLLRRLLAELRISVLDSDGSIPFTDKAYKKWAKWFLSEMKAFDLLDLSTLSDEALHEEFVKMEKALLKHYKLIRYGMVTHSIGTNLMVKRWLIDWLGDRTGELYARLVSGLPNNKTIETNIALERLASEARQDPALMELLKTTPSGKVIAELEKDTRYKPFLSSLEKFLNEYGHRSFTREIYFPRWANEPALVVDIIKSLAASRESHIEELEKQRFQDRRETEKEVSGKLGLLKRPIFNTVLYYAQIYLIFRENQRFYLDHQIYRQRRLFMEYGRRLMEKGLLERQDDVFFLSKEEVFAQTGADAPDMKKAIKSRRREFERYRDMLPPKFLRGNIDFDDAVDVDENARTITGTSASPGIATGTIRVVETIGALSAVEDGDILVTLNTDPGWTPVFSKIGALITETGGILSHGAVVSREYRIPAVTAVRNATHLLKNGQKVRVDGNEGIIYLLEELEHGH